MTLIPEKLVKYGRRNMKKRTLGRTELEVSDGVRRVVYELIWQ